MSHSRSTTPWLFGLCRRAEAFLIPRLGILPPERQRRLRLANWCLLVMAAMLFVWVVLNLAMSAWALDAWLGGFLLLTLVLLVMLRVGLDEAFVSHLTCLLMVAIISISSVYSGGLTAAILTLFAVIPVGAVTAAGRSGAFWLGPAIAAVVTIHACEVGGHVFDFLTPPDQRPLDAALTWLTSAMIVTLLIFYYEVAQRRAEDEMIQAMLQAEEASNVKSRFITRFGHEVRTPLHGILGMLSLMNDEASGAVRKKLGGEARLAGERLLGIISEVLEISRSGEPREAALTERRKEAGALVAAAVPVLRGGEERRVLVVEDDAVSRLLIVTLLRHMDLSVVEASSGREALAAYEQGRFRLVFMDCQLPDMDGEEVTRQMRQREMAGGSRRAAVVAVSAHVTEQQRATCRAAGMDDFLPKPFSKEDLEAMVLRWF